MVPAPLVPSMFPDSANHSAHILRFGVIDTAAVGQNKPAALARAESEHDRAGERRKKGHIGVGTG